MLISVVPIGNSKGIRLPKTILDQLNIVDTLDLEVDNQQIILKPIVNNPRKGWEKEFIKMHELNEDIILVDNSSNSEAFEWEW